MVATVGDIVVRNEALVLPRGVQYVGTLLADRLPEDLRNALKEYREAVDDMALSLADDALERVLEFGLFARLNPEGVVWIVRDLQLYDGTVLLVVSET